MIILIIVLHIVFMLFNNIIVIMIYYICYNILFVNNEIYYTYTVSLCWHII